MTAPAANIQPIQLLAGRFAANVAALATREPELAMSLRLHEPVRQFRLIIEGDALAIGFDTPAGVERLPNVVSVSSANFTAHQLFPAGYCDRSALVVGEDLGWLWNAIYRLPCQVAVLPTHRPPLYFLIGDLERLWILLHLQDWTAMMADPRVILLAGPDAVERFRAGLVSNTMLPWPLVSVVVDGSIWPAGVSLTDVRTEAQRSANDRFATIRHMMELTNRVLEPFDPNQSLRILGICSRYTTFLKHSMRDWMASFERLGHQTYLLMEQADHEVPNSLALSEACLDFNPDLIVSIDHYRAELTGVPDDVPVVMWVQDYLPTIFSPKAGAAQTDRDYTVGFAGVKLIHEFGYPDSRFVPALVGVDEERFSNVPCSPGELDALRCEASFVSHASTPAEAFLKAEIDRLNTPAATRLFTCVYDQLKAEYDQGRIVTEPVTIDRMIERAMRDTATSLPPEHVGQLTTFFTHKVNNALFRHQPLQWLADAGVDLRLYGSGWEKHPTLGKFARGPAEHGEHLRRIYQASAINLQITPHGALHQRLFEGYASGGFFLMRHVPGDLLERHLLAIADWCDRSNIATDLALRTRATPAIRRHIAAVAESLQLDPFATYCPLVDMARWSRATGCIRSAASVWGDDYDAVAFDNEPQLLAKTAKYLSHAAERKAIAERMRAVVVRRFTYTATSRRLLNAIAGDLNGVPRWSTAA